MNHRWPWGTLRIGSWLLPTGLALTLVGLVVAGLVSLTAAVLLGRHPWLPLALLASGAAVLALVQHLRQRRFGGGHPAVLPSLLLLYGLWSGLLLLARLPLLPNLDLLSLAVALQLAISRPGCTLAGCCYGLPASWGLVHPGICGTPPAGVRRLPWPLLEASGWLGIALAIALALAVAPAGTPLALLLLLYGLLRSALEPLRGDPVRRWRALRPAQLQAACCAALGGALLHPALRGLLTRQEGIASASSNEGLVGLTLLGFLAAVGLLWRRDLWGASIIRLSPQRQQELERTAQALLAKPPRHHSQPLQIGDLSLLAQRHGSGAQRAWRISVQRQSPPLSLAEAGWVLATFAGVIRGSTTNPPPVMAVGEGMFAISLPDPNPSAEFTASPGDRTIPHYYDPLLK